MITSLLSIIFLNCVWKPEPPRFLCMPKCLQQVSVKKTRGHYIKSNLAWCISTAVMCRPGHSTHQTKQVSGGNFINCQYNYIYLDVKFIFSFFFLLRGEKYILMCTLFVINFVFCSSIYQLWSDDLKKLFSEYFQSLADLHQFEKDTILGELSAWMMCCLLFWQLVMFI